MVHTSTAFSASSRLASPSCPNITYRLAISRKELKQAFELVWQAYVKVGMQRKGETGLRLTKYHLLPDSKVFIAVAHSERRKAGKIYNEEKIIGTLTVIQDGCLGLPAEEVSREQIVSMRQSGERLAEVIALASDQEGSENQVHLKLFRLAYEYCRRNGITCLIASLTERHISFYRRFLGFHPIGTLKNYKMANGIPVQVHYIGIESAYHLVERRSAALISNQQWRFFWEHDAEDILSEATSTYPWDNGKLSYFFSRCSYLFEQIDITDHLALSLEYKRFDCDLALPLPLTFRKTTSSCV